MYEVPAQRTTHFTHLSLVMREMLIGTPPPIEGTAARGIGMAQWVEHLLQRLTT